MGGGGSSGAEKSGELSRGLQGSSGWGAGESHITLYVGLSGEHELK